MQQTLFDTDMYLSVKAKRFLKMSLGKFYEILPIKELAMLLPEQAKGRKGWFNNEGKIALQFLKSKSGLSDEELLSRINTDWTYQMFCGLHLSENEELKDKDIIYRTRKFVAEHFELAAYQSTLIESWLPYLKDLHLGMTDATAYESYIEYPTDVKLLWQSIEWLNKNLRFLCHRYKINLPRYKFKDIKRAYISYSKLKRKGKKRERRLRKRLLYLCQKIMGQFLIIFKQSYEQTLLEYTDSNKLALNYKYLNIKELDAIKAYFNLIEKVYNQQQFHYDNPSEPIPNRIVNLAKPYLRPIVRGKERKRVEFGAKVNVWQVDGINFIEHFSFEAFHEGVRLKQCIAFHTKYFGKLSQLAADQIYATNENRKHCTALEIATSFVPKGRRIANKEKRQQEDKMRQQLGKARATILEGSFGNEKNHYGLQKVKARNEKTEIIWIFFGIMTANAVKLSKRA